VDGILGLAPTQLGKPEYPLPFVTDLYKRKKLNDNVFSLFLDDGRLRLVPAPS